MWVLALLAQANRADNDPLRRPEVIWGTIGLAAALLAGAVVIWMVDRWRKRDTDATASSAGELSDFREMYDRGEITAEEYARLRNQVAQRVKLSVPSSPPGGGATADPSSSGSSLPPPAPPQMPPPPPTGGGGWSGSSV